ncbi:ABC transporter substrate-binding protein [Bacillus benzoevorans]|uniref:Branched-chain amino acid transport system substrate-binding protein n=1 Tax=Bacillus benzoevorans TaxID=1456 RepID=A0A7X0HS18_9BACI|nr:ABC transporter substrate-binding protein [Bacillus benzoevorans]MBB6445763.1 branched-chain amino acid transport system substrate-binding protein [Bacillus benzoevorans]
MRKRKLNAIFMSLMLSAGLLAACGTKDDSAAGGKADGDTIKVGVNLELSGNVASYGSAINDGIKLAVDEINKEGIDGKKIKLITVDNKSDAAESTNAALKLISQDQVSVILGASVTANSMAQVQLAQENKIPVIAPPSTAPELTYKDGKLNDFIFRTCFIDPYQGKIGAEYATKDLGLKNAAILVDNSSDYSLGLTKAFKDTLSKNGGKVVAQEAYMAKDTDFRSILTNIKAKNPEFIYVPGYYEEVGLILKQAKEIGLNVPFVGGDGLASPTLVDIAGTDAVNNVYFTNHYSSSDTAEIVQNFVKAFEAKYKKTPDAFNALGYDTGYLLADAIKRAGGGDPEKIKKALEETEGLSLVTSDNFKFDKQHNPIKSAVILSYENGKEVFKTKINPES